MENRPKRVLVGVLMAFVAASLATCGGNGDGDDGDGGGGAPTADFEGLQVESLELPAAQPDQGVVEGPVGGIQVVATSGGSSQSTTTDNAGNFSFGPVPSGDVTITFNVSADCAPAFPILDVVDGSTISAARFQLDCPPDRNFIIGPTETYRGIVGPIEGEGSPVVRASLAGLQTSDSARPSMRSVGTTWELSAKRRARSREGSPCILAFASSAAPRCRSPSDASVVRALPRRFAMPKGMLEAGKRWTTSMLEELGHSGGYEWGPPLSDIPKGRTRRIAGSCEQLVLTSGKRRKVIWIAAEYLRGAGTPGPAQALARAQVRARLADALGELVERAG